MMCPEINFERTKDFDIEADDLGRIKDLLGQHRIREVVVIGHNGSGFDAAVSAARHGAGVTLLEGKGDLTEVYPEAYPELDGLAEVIHGCRVITVEQDEHRWFEGGEFYLLVNAVCKGPIQFTAIAVILAKTMRSHVIVKKNKGFPGFFTALEEDDAHAAGKAAAHYAWTAWRAE